MNPALSSELHDLLLHMFEPDEEDRYNFRQVLNHTWLQQWVDSYNCSNGMITFREQQQQKQLQQQQQQSPYLQDEIE